MMEVYKVVSKGLKYWPRVDDDIYYSSRTILCEDVFSKSVLMYKIGKVTRPNFGLIFCFDNFADALKFANKYSGIILKGVGIPASKSSRIFFGNCNIEGLLLSKMWEGAIYSVTTANLVHGTVLMRTFRPLEVIYPQKRR